MKDFFSSTRFKILLGAAIVICTFILRAAWTGGFGTLTSSILGAVTMPLQKASASISASVSDFVGGFANAGAIKAENEQLKEQIRLLNETIVDYDKIKHQNDVYNELWSIRDNYQDMELEPAQVIGSDSSDRFYSFTIDKGKLDGVDLRNSVHTPAGLVGVVTEVGLTYSKVSTILDPSINISVYDTRTRDTGIINGTVELAERGMCKLSYLPRESGAARGDLVATSGVSGRYPKDQIIGRIVEVAPESHGNSLYAVIEPTVDIKTVKDVIVIKSFVGMGDSTVEITQAPSASQDEPSPQDEPSQGDASSSQDGSAASNPASTAASNPASTAASNPAGTAASNPAGTAASNPAGTAASNPAGTAASNPASTAASNPASSSGADEPPPNDTERPEASADSAGNEGGAGDAE